MEFQRNIEKTLIKSKLNDRDEAEILYERIVILEKENECLKNEVRNQKEIIQTLLTDERKERWKTVNKRNSEFRNKFYERQTSVPVNLQNRFQNLEEPNITEQHNDAIPQNSHQNTPIENTKSRSRFEKRNTNPIRQEGKKNQIRPDNCITEKYLNNHVTLRKNHRVVPGNKTKYGKKIMVIGDSHLNRIKRNLFNNSFDNAKSFIKSFGGAKTEHMKHYVLPSLKEQKPDIIDINVGGNDINYKNTGNINVNELADNIISLAMICRDSGVPDVVISELLPKKSIAVTAIIRKANDRMRELCNNNKFHFISHQHITRDFLYQDGVHLTDPGTEILAENIVDYIYNFIL